MPRPNANETKDQYVQRCMRTAETVSKYPDAKQRYAVCNSLWDQFTKEYNFDISKIDMDERNVFGIFSMTRKNGDLLIDSDGESIDSSELEKAAYKFNLYARAAGDSHARIGVGRLIESFVVTKQKMDMLAAMLMKVGVEGVNLTPNSEFWFGGFHIDDDATWEMIKSGEYSSFSIGGKADRVVDE